MNRLKELEIEEVSFVDAGANPQAQILLFKRKETNDMADKIDKTDKKENVVEKQEPVVEVKDAPKADEVAKAKEEVAALEEQKKSELAKLEQDRADLSKAKETFNALISKLQEQVEKSETAESLQIAKKYELLGLKAEELAPQLKQLKASPELYDTMIKLLDTALTTQENLGVFAEIGKKGFDNGTVSVEKYAAEIQKANPSMSWRWAIEKAYEQHPELNEG